MTFRFGSPPGAGATLPKITPISGASSLTERYSSPVRCELRYQPAPLSKPVRRWMIRKSGATSLVLLAFGMSAIGALTLMVAKMPSSEPSVFYVRVAIVVAIVLSPSVASGTIPDGSRVERRQRRSRRLTSQLY
jgi:hypothetical protein